MTADLDAIAQGCGPHCGHWDDMQEIERLRSLIAEWAEADAVVQRQKNLNRYSNRDVPTVFSRRLSDAAEALRAEARKVKS